ncbi:MAG: 30S ribosomal protein S20 [Chloroflexi bacterium]|nr:30S ribosomal protein S20 [Chloroflexota bacterium]
MAKLANVESRRLRNKSVRRYVKTCSAKAEELISANDIEAAKAAVVSTVSALDRAAKKGVIHPKKAARRKSRLMKKLNQSAKAHAAPAQEPA